MPQYRARLGEVRDALVRARASVATARGPLVINAQSLLRRTDQLALASGESIAVDDSALATVDVSDAAIDAAIARLDTSIAFVAHIGAPAVDAAKADARLRELVASAPSQASNGDLFDAITSAIVRFLSGLEGPGVDLTVLWPALGLLGISVVVFIVAVLGRALPERVRKEVLVRGGAIDQRVDPAVHLRAADAAIASSRARDAIHSIFLYAISALAEREVIRYDPALTDRELVMRAAAIPHADAFRDLVAIYERSWFGLREPSVDEARRARALALRVAP